MACDNALRRRIFRSFFGPISLFSSISEILRIRKFEFCCGSVKFSRCVMRKQDDDVYDVHTGNADAIVANFKTYEEYPHTIHFSSNFPTPLFSTPP